MAANMGLIAKNVSLTQLASQIPCAKLALEALQEIKLNTAGKPLIRKCEYRKSQEKQKKFEPYVLTNGDTLKQLLARSRYFYTKQIKVV
jgi:hypothetical protein